METINESIPTDYSLTSSAFKQDNLNGEDIENTESESLGESSNSVYHHHIREVFDFVKTIGTGTFGRVVLVREKETKKFFAMKVLRIADVCRLRQTDHINNEKEILLENRHPFVVRLYWTNHDQTFLYMLMEYLSGGELFTYLRTRGRFSSYTSSFYAAEIILALEFLHFHNTVYRDLKPENLLLDRDGHLKIIDFGFAKRLDDSRTWTLCGTPEYLAPEIIQSKGHNKAVDWWALGILIFEMLIGYPPFYDITSYGIYEKILTGKIEWPKQMDMVAKDLIKKLLVQDRVKRLGNMKNGATDVKRHKWFKEIDWDGIYMKKTLPPILPLVSHNGDTRNFDEYPDDKYFFDDTQPATPEQRLQFKNF